MKQKKEEKNHRESNKLCYNCHGRLTFSISTDKIRTNNMVRERMSGIRLLSEVQAIRSQRARAGESPRYAPFDPKIELQFDLNRLRGVETRRQRRMARVLSAAIK